MSGFIRFVGSMFIFVWVAITFLNIDIREFFPNDDYSPLIDDFMNVKWLLLIIGIILSLVASITKIKQRREVKNKRNRRQNNHNISDNSNESNFKSGDLNADFASDFVKKDFVAEQHKYKRDQFASRQSEKLKEIAMKTDWTPLCGGGSNFKTTSLKRINVSRIETSKSKGGFAFGGVFALAGFGILFGMTYVMFEDRGLSSELLFPVLFGSVFATIGTAMLIWPRSRIFDLQQGWFWAGSKSLSREQDFMALKKSARVSDIAAIQVLAERISGNKGGSYTSWEINIVSNDGKRLNVMDHGNQDSIIDDAEVLGEFLNVPVWENT